MSLAAPLPTEVRTAALRWIADDPSPADRDELQRVLADAMAGRDEAVADLTDRMRAPLTFGTAGLRGPLRAGPAGMNLAVVRRAAAGIGRHLRATGAAGRTVIVGHDARHRSAEFARDAAGVLAAQGFTALLAPGPLPTPVTAFAVRHLGAAAGVQITASHNPPNDNGVKVYLADGAQLVGPADARIEAEIAAVPAAVSVDVGTPGAWPDDLVDAYVDRLGELARTAPAADRSSLRVALTPMHGVGGEVTVRGLRAAGITDVHVVAAQAVPDPDFPTVPFPNPEEPGATDRLLALAADVDAHLAIALDPDADRCALGIPGPDGWRMLTGDEAGALLGDHLLRTLDRTAHPDPLVATTIVSGEQLQAIAARHRARYDETLTGFKWIVRAGDGSGTGLVFGYEEALGLCVDPGVVRDKDGISAAVVAADLTALLRSTGATVADRLAEIVDADGLFVTGPLSIRVTRLADISDAMRRIRATPPTELLGDDITESADLLPRTDAVRWRTTRVRVVVRPSGTEPKLKAYLQVRGTDGQSADQVRADLNRLREEVRAVRGL